MSNKKKAQSASDDTRRRGSALMQQQRAKEKRRNALIQAGIALTAVVAVLLVTVAVLNARGAGQAEVVPEAVNADGGFVVGDAAADTTITVYEDLQCPACKAFEDASGEKLTELAESGDVAVEYRIISFLDSPATDNYSSRAANASACVMEQGEDTWAAFHQAMYEQQSPETGPGLTDEEILQIAVEAGADESTTESCIADGTYDDWVQQVTDESGDDGVSSTPTVMVNGEVSEARTPEELQTAVDEASS